MDSRSLQLQPRLQLLANLIPQDARLADVGTDHGYLPVWLLQQGRVSSAIASDINAEPLAHAAATATEYGVMPQIDLRLCAGLEAIAPHEVDTVVIAGMGGETIMAILAAAPWTREPPVQLLLQPMTKVEMLRHWLYDKGYHFTSEHLVWDKNFLYPIFCVTGGKRAALTDVQAYGGVALADDPLYGDYLARQIQKLQKKIAGLHSAKDEDAAAYATHYEAICRALEKERNRICAL